MGISLSLTLMSFDNSSNSNYGNSVEVTNNSNLDSSADDVAVTAALL
ncbi:hypothetical protein [Flavobacterium sp.]